MEPTHDAEFSTAENSAVDVSASLMNQSSFSIAAEHAVANIVLGIEPLLESAFGGEIKDASILVRRIARAAQRACEDAIASATADERQATRAIIDDYAKDAEDVQLQLQYERDSHARILADTRATALAALARAAQRSRARRAFGLWHAATVADRANERAAVLMSKAVIRSASCRLLSGCFSAWRLQTARSKAATAGVATTTTQGQVTQLQARLQQAEDSNAALRSQLLEAQAALAVLQAELALQSSINGAAMSSPRPAESRPAGVFRHSEAVLTPPGHGLTTGNEGADRLLSAYSPRAQPSQSLLSSVSPAPSGQSSGTAAGQSVHTPPRNTTTAAVRSGMGTGSPAALLNRSPASLAREAAEAVAGLLAFTLPLTIQGQRGGAGQGNDMHGGPDEGLCNGAVAGQLDISAVSHGSDGAEAGPNTSTLDQGEAGQAGQAGHSSVPGCVQETEHTPHTPEGPDRDLTLGSLGAVSTPSPRPSEVSPRPTAALGLASVSPHHRPDNVDTAYDVHGHGDAGPARLSLSPARELSFSEAGDQDEHDGHDLHHEEGQDERPWAEAVLPSSQPIATSGQGSISFSLAGLGLGALEGLRLDHTVQPRTDVSSLPEPPAPASMARPVHHQHAAVPAQHYHHPSSAAASGVSAPTAVSALMSHDTSLCSWGGDSEGRAGSVAGLDSEHEQDVGRVGQGLYGPAGHYTDRHSIAGSTTSGARGSGAANPHAGQLQYELGLDQSGLSAPSLALWVGEGGASTTGMMDRFGRRVCSSAGVPLASPWDAPSPPFPSPPLAKGRARAVRPSYGQVGKGQHDTGKGPHMSVHKTGATSTARGLASVPGGSPTGQAYLGQTSSMASPPPVGTTAGQAGTRPGQGKVTSPPGPASKLRGVPAGPRVYGTASANISPPSRVPAAVLSPLALALAQDRSVGSASGAGLAAAVRVTRH